MRVKRHIGSRIIIPYLGFLSPFGGLIISVEESVRACLQRLPLLVKVDSILCMVDTGYEIVLEALYATELLKALTHRHFQDIVGLLYLSNVDFLKICHLQEPVQDYFFLVQRHALKLVKEGFGP